MSIASKVNKILDKITGKKHSYSSKTTEAMLDVIAREPWNVYTKQETRDLIAQQSHLAFMIVDELPTENIRTDRIYCIPVKDGKETEKNLYNEYVYIDNDWESLGTSAIGIDSGIFNVYLNDYDDAYIADTDIESIFEKYKDGNIVILNIKQKYSQKETFTHKYILFNMDFDIDNDHFSAVAIGLDRYNVIGSLPMILLFNGYDENPRLWIYQDSDILNEISSLSSISESYNHPFYIKSLNSNPIFNYDTNTGYLEFAEDVYFIFSNVPHAVTYYKFGSEANQYDIELFINIMKNFGQYDRHMLMCSDVVISQSIDSNLLYGELTSVGSLKFLIKIMGNKQIIFEMPSEYANMVCNNNNIPGGRIVKVIITVNDVTNRFEVGCNIS